MNRSWAVWLLIAVLGLGGCRQGRDGAQDGMRQEDRPATSNPKAPETPEAQQAPFQQLTVAVEIYPPEPSITLSDLSLTIEGDGSYHHRIAPSRLDETGYEDTYQLRPEDLEELKELLVATDWLTNIPKPRETPLQDHWTEYTFTLTRDGERIERICYGGDDMERCEALNGFVRRIDRQERLLYWMSRDKRYRLQAARDLDGELEAVRGDPHRITPYAPVLDYHRLWPTFKQVLEEPEGRPNEEIEAAIQLASFLGLEDQREVIFRFRDVASAEVARALAEFGGDESIAMLRQMLEHGGFQGSPENGAGSHLVRMGEPAVPTVIEVIEASAEPDADYEQVAAAGNLIHAYIEHWSDVDHPVDPRVVQAVHRSMAAGRVQEFRTEYHEHFLDLAKWMGEDPQNPIR